MARGAVPVGTKRGVEDEEVVEVVVVVVMVEEEALLVLFVFRFFVFFPFSGFVLRAAFVANCFRGATLPVLLRAFVVKEDICDAVRGVVFEC